MSFIEENDHLIIDYIESTYEQLTKVVNAKNDIKNNITLNADELTGHKTKVEELEKILHGIRSEISSNPILKELNITSEEKAIEHRKLAENIYSELPDLSSELDIYEENFCKFNEKNQLLEKLQKDVEKKLDENVNIMSSLRDDWKKWVEEFRKSQEQDISKNCQELENEIAQLSETITEETTISKSLTYEIESKQAILENRTEMNDQNSKIWLYQKKVNDNENSLLSEKEIELNNELTELIEKADKIKNESKVLEQQILSKHIFKTKLQEQFTMRKIFKKKKMRYTSIQNLKTKLAKKQKEFLHVETKILQTKNSSTEKSFMIEFSKIECTKISDEIESKKQISEQLSYEKEEICENKKTTEKIMTEMNEKLSKLLERKNEDELSIRINNEKQTAILEEIDKIEENLCVTTKFIEELNEQISKIQFEINEREKLSEISSHVEMEKENKLLDTKIRRYAKAIEICKRNKAAEIAKRTNYNDFSDSSEDSMLIKNKKIIS